MLRTFQCSLYHTFIQCHYHVLYECGHNLSQWKSDIVSSVFPEALLLSGRLTGVYTYIYIHKGEKVCFVYVHVSKYCGRCKALILAGPTN